jgi:hypothetical protein
LRKPLRTLRLGKSLTAKNAKRKQPRTLRKDFIYQHLFQLLIRILNILVFANRLESRCLVENPPAKHGGQPSEDGTPSFCQTLENLKLNYTKRKMVAKKLRKPARSKGAKTAH